MTNVERLEDISQALALLANQTAAENLGGLYSKNRLAEDLLLPVFQEVFGAPDLKNANAGVNNFAHVDLVAPVSKLAIQVTTERTAAKITGTLEGFLESKLDEHYSRLVIFVLTSHVSRYHKSSKDKWKKQCAKRLVFSPDRDIIAPENLLPLVQALPQAALESVHQVLERSVLGKKFLDVEAQLENFSRRSLRYELDSGKYIPDVFIETDRTKQLARIFCHPSLFFRRAMERYPQASFDYWNEFLEKAALPTLTVPDRTVLKGDATLASTVEDAASMGAMLAVPIQELARYEDADERNIPLDRVAPKNRGFIEQNSWRLGWDFAGGFSSTLQDFVLRTSAASRSICLLTGTAGQGKTNFVCDLVDTFLARQGVPCAYFSVRRLALRTGASLGERIIGSIFDQKVVSFQEGAARLSEFSGRSGKPFVLILDGLNEHPNGPRFAQELDDFLQEFLSFPALRILLTCRSEYLEQRFGNLERFEDRMVRLRVLPRYFGEEEQRDLITAYFAFFGLDPALVDADVTKRLEDDVLLLRFFCEAYGTRGKDDGYRQPSIQGIYRDEIFEIYLKRKLEAISAMAAIGSGIGTQESDKSVRSILKACLSFMLETWQFADIPITVIPENQMEALERLLDEELIVRRDAPNVGGFFAPNDETLNFTFDEFRDFLLAQFLVQNVFAVNRKKFDEYLSKSTPDNTSAIEGLKKFLFFLGRKQSDQGFYTHYKDHPWYQEVFQTEVFNLPGSLLNDEDEAEIRGRLMRCDVSAKITAIDLAFRWNPVHSPVLNLDLLLDVVWAGDEETYRKLILEVFGRNSYGGNGVSAGAFADLVTRHILPKLGAVISDALGPLFELLVLLLPVDADYDLSSPTFHVLKQMTEQRRDYVLDLLLWSLERKLSAYVPFVWRLLAHAEKTQHAEAALQLARLQVNSAVSSEASLEIDRFLDAAAVHVQGGEAQ